MISSSRFRLITNLIFSYLITFAVFNLGGFQSSDILLGVLFVVCLVSLNRIRGVGCGTVPEYGREVTVTSYVIAGLWTVLYMIYAADKMTGGMENKLFISVYVVFTAAGIYLFLFFALRYVTAFLSGFCLERASGDHDGSFEVKRFLIRTGFIFLCLLPLFLINYPGTMTIDSYEQFNQARGLYAPYDLHPWAHTLLIRLFYHIGYAINGRALTGIAAFVLAQMTLLSFSVSYSIEALAEAGLKRAGRIALLLGYVLFPYNLAYAITMWKDVLFGAASLVFVITIYRMSYRSAWAVRDIILFFVSGLGLCLFRHNGFYAFILTMIVILICVRRNRRLMLETLILSVVMTAAVCTFNGPVKRACGVEKVEFAHSLTIPLQQIARVVAYNGDISEEDMEMIEAVNTTEYLRNHYTPGGSDPTMQWMIFGNSEYVESHKLKYLGLWFRLGLRNPHAYVEAYIDQTRGYYTTMLPEQTEFYGLLPNGDDLYNEPLFLETKRIKINELCFKLHKQLPIYGILYSCGACVQLMMLGIALILIARKKGCRPISLIAYVPLAAILCTVLIAAPLCADLRYIYSLMISFPELIAITFLTYSFRTE